MLSPVLRSVAARPPPEEPAEEPPEGLQPDGAAGGQRLAAPDRRLHAQPDPDHGRGQFPSPRVKHGSGGCWIIIPHRRGSGGISHTFHFMFPHENKSAVL